MRRRSLVLIFLAAATSGATIAAPPALGADRVLSNERTVTRWAHPAALAAVRAAPSTGARQVGRLHFDTEDGVAEVYVALRSRLDDSGNGWTLIRLPGRPNGRTGWVRSGDLETLQTVTTRLVINQQTLRATLTRAGRRVFSAPVGVGKASTPTPAGRFWIREKLTDGRFRSFYGPIAFGTSAYSALSDWPGGGVIGIHGTTLPGLVPGRPSHGCVRLRNPDLLRLARLMPIGTPVQIT